MLCHFTECADKGEFQTGAENRTTVDFNHMDIIIFQDCAVNPQFDKFILDDTNPIPFQVF